MEISEIEDGYFDAHEVFDKLSDSEDDDSSDESLCSTSGVKYDYWIGNLDDSVDERRNRFMKSVGLGSKGVVKDEEIEPEKGCFRDDFVEKVKEDNKQEVLVKESSDFDDGVLIRQPSLSCWSNTGFELQQPSGFVNKNVTFVRHGEEDDLSVKQSFEFGSSSSSRKDNEIGTLLDRRKKVKKGWLKKLNVIAHRITDHHLHHHNQYEPMMFLDGVNCTKTVNVHINKKKSKELSSVYTTQDFPAHNGSISVLKFSHDGRYLASAGDDCIVRIWEITEHHEDPSKYEIQGNDPSKLYFSTNHLSELAPINVDKEKNRKIKKPSELTCVILPPKVFRILEKPVHEFHGHGGEILSLSWSKKGYLLSSSVDKTVRLWQIGHHECIKVFTHNNYVTSVEFNPVDENYFISGSIDGKVRIWEVSGCQVIEWIDNREIVTAVSYYPNGKGCIVGTLDGNCSLYDIIDKRLQLDTHICIMSKKKWPRRITGFQFCPTDSRKVIVSSADSQVRVLCGVNVVGKFKGNRCSGGQMSASFTSDGKHIVSAGDDSNIYMWNHATSDKLYSKAKSNLSSESFFSQNASVAVPWSGIKSIAAAFPSPRLTSTTDALPRSTINSPRKPSLSTSRSFFLESMLKSPPTFPAETLPDSTQVSVSPSMRKSEYRFLRSAYRSTFVAPHTWGLVIVTAGLDGRIRTYLNYGLPVRQ
uniref:WD repeat-containing protein 44-like n=1 Tax=Erigeron canadensis TaxID=72917 RepID=UPI001CB9943C|nr:WD repeat-containing protein 44-like [Erigeron canadensis]